MKLNWLKRFVAGASVLVFLLMTGCSATNVASSASPTEYSGSVQIQTASASATPSASETAASDEPQGVYSEEITTQAPSATPSATATLKLNPKLKMPLPSLAKMLPTLDP